ncbi:penicillin-binding protein 1A [Polymorphobacter glacialis]|uniref:Penicillin-binding protein 1A n=1 Tax=Sandarakinorhabdus glacialis TaxID=1614636 RepID=A0A916ZPD0_9SPHN|nr:PBP1A family penicillin-binding protein [Polymorphobacter glacialis]GGE06489.1 penicillin-binding protein 1A [Polymorphobacter glacialis]
MRRWFIWGFLGLVLAGVLGAALIYRSATKDLPDEGQLANFSAALPSTVRDIDGNILTTFTRERRIYLDYNEIPKKLVEAYISAEDKTFFEHGGLDYAGIVNAVFTNIGSMVGGGRPVGASTITQQVAKSLIGNEVTYTRKLREAILARRIESVFSKQEILELYLNQIFLGRNAYGVEAAAQAYFGKSATQLDLAEMAYLAILPKAPSTYSPVSQNARSVARRDYVLGQMLANGYITAAERADAAATPLVAVPNRSFARSRTSDYFVEDVRRTLMEKFGESERDGRNSVYGGGLWIRTSANPVLQDAAERAMRDGFMRYERGRAWRGPATNIGAGEGWQERLRGTAVATGYDDWKKAVVLSKQGSSSALGFADGSRGVLPGYAASSPLKGTQTSAGEALKPGDVIPVVKNGNAYALRQTPEVSGGMVVQDPHTGRVLAMVGGFDAGAQSFNRATQAQRQPGSTFKPIVYATAMDNGFTPSSIVVDAPYCVYQSRSLGQKCFRNFGNMRGAGAQTMRWGLEQSRNLMTVRIAYNTGMDKVVAQAKALGIGDYQPVLAIALGAGETTVMKLTNAYAQLFNAGRAMQPSLIDMVQDRDGKVIYRGDNRTCPGCAAPDWNGEAMPRPGGVPKQAIDARTAFQTVHLMEGVVTRGTATRLLTLDRPLAGKTGTTSGPKDVWFVGGTQDLVAGLYLGYDKPRDLGGYVQGGTVAAPIWLDFAKVALKHAPKLPFNIPAGVRMVRVDRRSGKRVFGTWPTNEAKAAVIWEAFKPDSEPRRTSSVGGKGRGTAAAPKRVRSDAEFMRNSGGIY